MIENYEENWEKFQKKQLAFWERAEDAEPLIAINHSYILDPQFLGKVYGGGELPPERLSAAPILPEFDRVVEARKQIGDDILPISERLVGVPWLEAMCGCRVMVAGSGSAWPEPPADVDSLRHLQFSPDNPWFTKLIDLTQGVSEYAGDRCPMSLGHYRGPSDVLIALFGSSRLLLGLYDDPERMRRLAGEVADIWRESAEAERRIVPSYRGGYCVRQFGLWSPEPCVWVQDDTSAMISLPQYKSIFLEAMRKICFFPYSVLHLHIPSLHLAEMFAGIQNIRAINFYFDSQTITLQTAMPVLRRLQSMGMPLILAKDIYHGFSLEEYREILEGLSPRGLCVHLGADSVEEGRFILGEARNLGSLRARSQPG